MKTFRKSAVSVLLVLVAVTGLFTAYGQSGRAFMWVAESNTATVYLLGSMHAAQKDLYPLDARIENAFAKSDTLVVEVDESEMGAQAAMQLAAKGIYPPGDALDKHISPKLMAAVDARFKKLGAPVPYKQFRPWMVATLLDLLTMQNLGFDPMNGIDIHFMTKAKGAKSIVALETADQQISLFTGLTDAEQESLLELSERDADNVEKFLTDMVAMWKAGDDVKLDQSLNKSIKDSPQLATFQKKLLDDRNVAMAAKIEGFLKTNKTYFVVVGAGHLVGEAGLVRLLGKNYKVVNIADVAAAVPARR